MNNKNKRDTTQFWKEGEYEVGKTKKECGLFHMYVKETLWERRGTGKRGGKTTIASLTCNMVKQKRKNTERDRRDTEG